MSGSNGIKKNVILGVTGSIANFKAVELVGQLKKNKFNVNVIMTPTALNFLTPLPFKSQTGNLVVTDNHIKSENEAKSDAELDLVEQADIMVIAPATANTMTKLSKFFRVKVFFDLVRKMDGDGEIDIALPDELKPILEEFTVESVKPEEKVDELFDFIKGITSLGCSHDIRKECLNQILGALKAQEYAPLIKNLSIDRSCFVGPMGPAKEILNIYNDSSRYIMGDLREALYQLLKAMADNALCRAVWHLKPETKLLIAPSQAGEMWKSEGMKKDVACLREQGVYFIGPEEGFMGGTYDRAGRFWKVDEIAVMAAKLVQ